MSCQRAVLTEENVNRFSWTHRLVLSESPLMPTLQAPFDQLWKHDAKSPDTQEIIRAVAEYRPILVSSPVFKEEMPLHFFCRFPLWCQKWRRPFCLTKWSRGNFLRWLHESFSVYQDVCKKVMRMEPLWSTTAVLKPLSGCQKILEVSKSQNFIRSVK